MTTLILAEEAAWPNPDAVAGAVVLREILAEEAAWPNPDTVMFE